MPHIGSANCTPTGFASHIHTLTMLRSIVLVEASPSPEAADVDLNSQSRRRPDYRIYLHDENREISADVGAGWKRTGERVGTYITCIIDDPVFPKPIRARLLQGDKQDELWSLYWNRSIRREARD